MTQGVKVEPRAVLTGPALRRPVRAPLCLTELGEGEGGEVGRRLRRQDAVDTLVLTRRAGRRELLALLSAGVRGAVAAEAPGAVHIMPRATAALTLSDRERVVLRLVAEGNTNDAVGAHLGVSGLTVKSHLSRIGRKLGTGDRAEMVAVAIRRRLIP